ncbi:MAG: cysteine peptidase family C39 domain-containing protein [Candidatus Promineifilaceae bacterium]
MSFWQAWIPPLESGQHWLVPETVQTSNMDCGPAALKSILEGFGIPVHFGRLREACQTSVDGTSIQVLEEVSNQLGLEAQEVMVPVDHLLLPETAVLPAILVVRLPNGLTHFIVVWRVDGGRVQVMDPSIGRRWLTEAQLLEQLYVHEFDMSAAAWREWAGTEGFTDPLTARLTALHIDATQRDELLAHALADDGWFPLATLDAATRLVSSLVHAEAIGTGNEAATLLTQLIESSTMATAWQQIPAHYWFVRPANGAHEDETVMVRGAVLVSVTGVQEAASDLDEALEEEAEGEDEDEEVDELSAELAQALAEPEPHPFWEMWRLLREDGLLAPSVVTLATALAAIGVTLEALLLRGVLDAGALLTLQAQRTNALLLVLSFGILMIALEFWLSDTVQRMGRHLDMRLRIAFLSKIPHLGDRYFQSRLISDMSMRAHELASVRQFPSLGVRFLRLTFQLLLTTLGVAILIPQMFGVVLVVLVAAVLPSLLMQPLLQEHDLRLRAHSGGLSRFYLDGLLGLVTIKAHSAENAIETAHEMLLTEWVKAGRSYNQVALWVQGIQALVGTVGAVAIMLRYLAIGGSASGVLLLFYWVLNLPQLGQQLAAVTLQYPQIRNRVLRILEPLGAPNESDRWSGDPISETPVAAESGMAIQMQNVHVEAGGNAILRGIDVAIGAGEHVAIVGASGAGKSSLVGLLLGWYWASEGVVSIDGVPLHGSRLDTIRQETAWVDPTVQIWNRELIDNLLYGNSAEPSHLNPILDQADLYDVLERLPDGLQTKLGEGGGLVSGGEGQRVRLGRSLLRKDARLIILDEPFRGLDRPQRQALLAKLRAYWSDATLLFISHDVSDTQTFERVFVIDEGQLVEDAAPHVLAQQADSAYRKLLDAEDAVRRGLWESTEWRHLRLENGTLHEKTP